MNQQFLKEIEMGSKNALIKKRIITHYIYNGSSTITDLSKELDLSVPTITKFISEMCEDGYINDNGKLETSGGRIYELWIYLYPDGKELQIYFDNAKVVKMEALSPIDVISEMDE